MFVLRLTVISFLSVAGFCYAQTSSGPVVPAHTGIQGYIRISPGHGGAPELGAQSSKPLANASFVATDDTGAAAEFMTDDQGWFKVSLGPAHYTVTRKGPEKAIGRYGPFDIDVVTGQMTRVEWQCDSGMR